MDLASLIFGIFIGANIGIVVAGLLAANHRERQP